MFVNFSAKTATQEIENGQSTRAGSLKWLSLLAEIILPDKGFVSTQW